MTSMSALPKSLSFSLRYFFFTVLLVLVGIDLASTLRSPSTIKAIPVSQLKSDGVPTDYSTKVSLVRSDDSSLPDPATLTTKLSDPQILEMVYRVLDREGHLQEKLFAGANVVIKPNVVEPADLENGVNTDPRVVEGLIRWLVANGPEGMTYTIAEGAGGWIAPEMRNTKYNSGNAPVVDGFAQAGYKQMLQRLAADGIQATLMDINFGSYAEPLKGLQLAQTPEWIDFPEISEYWIHEVILNADVLIDVPVMKSHTPQITVCLKNYIGIAAGAKYGIWKGVGGPDPTDPAGLHQDWPTYNSVEHEIVDLAAIAPADYCLVDALVCKERFKTVSDPAVRRNLVLAGTDMVAVDTICAQLMGLNPDDVPHLREAAREGLGTMNMEQIQFDSDRPLEDSLYYFEHPTEDAAGNRGHYGGTHRTWLLNRFQGTDLSNIYLGVPDAQATGVAGQNGWTEPIQFSDDIIDFEAQYSASDGNTYYAFCWVDVPTEQDAELWIAHDESCAVWIGGEEVYSQAKSYQAVGLPGRSAKKIHLKAGVQPLLVKLVDTTRTAPFVLNLCRILPSQLPAGKATFRNLAIAANYKRYEGTRILGLKFSTTSTPAGIPAWVHY